MQTFTMSAAGHLEFGAGRIRSLAPMLAAREWTSIVLITGSSFRADSELRTGLLEMFQSEGITVRSYRYDRMPAEGEPFNPPPGDLHEASPQVVDAIVRAERLGSDPPVRAVVALGGGSTIDTGKAVSAALTLPHPIADYLEGVGTQVPPGTKIPFVAIPTTAGTGSEVTKNAVLSSAGAASFKKSLRHDSYVPDVAIVDPELHLSCPRAVTAASGLDAITQLIEALLSVSASPLTDALALDGLQYAGRSFARAVERGDTDIDARAGMAYAAYLSGRCLANAGLGVVHGLAGPAGAHTTVPHGVFCGLLLLPSITLLTERLKHQRSASRSLAKLAAAAHALGGMPRQVPSRVDVDGGVSHLLARLTELDRVAGLPRLSAFGMDAGTVSLVAAEGGSKNSPVDFDESERLALLQSVLN